MGFVYPANIEGLPNTDQVYGHGTFVAGVVAGSGAASNGRYTGVAPGAKIVGLSAGDLTLSFVLAGFDYLLEHGAALNVRVINCSFSANTVFDTNDPVNVATKMLTDNGVNVVFSAGNTGAGLHTLNPYAVAPWVVSVGATDERARLADFSSRGAFGSSLFRPTLGCSGRAYRRAAQHDGGELDGRARACIRQRHGDADALVNSQATRSRAGPAFPRRRWRALSRSCLKQIRVCVLHRLETYCNARPRRSPLTINMKSALEC